MFIIKSLPLCLRKKHNNIALRTMCPVFFSNNSFLFHFRIPSTWTYPGGIELREALMPSNKKSDKSLETNSSYSIATKKEEKSNCEMKVAVTQDSKSSIEVIKDETCSVKEDGNQFMSCKDEVSCKTQPNVGDEQQDSDPAMKKSP